ncbi:hypothetical protein L596_024793 [Steinernema carpocapsae]|uniref:Uncharacterized protein n=1 Tax=Steinernema carpocapsae TaxID=34508 RepID=A0A4U5M5T9_STECR|nr:hypothetical protein L596_024793 [Steinernema carpocapsae]
MRAQDRLLHNRLMVKVIIPTFDPASLLYSPIPGGQKRTASSSSPRTFGNSDLLPPYPRFPVLSLFNATLTANKADIAMDC